MKIYIKLALFFVFMGMGAVLFAEEENGKQTYKMETSFPVPYVAYDQVNVRQELQMGLNEAPVISVGNSAAAAALDVRSMAEIGENATVSLGNIGNVTYNDNANSFIRLGTGNTQAGAEFSKVTITTINASSGDHVNKADVGGMSAATVNLYGGSLPNGCKEAGWIEFPVKGTCDNMVTFFGCRDTYVAPCCPSYKIRAYENGADDCSVNCKQQRRQGQAEGYEFDCSYTCEGQSNSSVIFPDDATPAKMPDRVAHLIEGGSKSVDEFQLCDYGSFAALRLTVPNSCSTKGDMFVVAKTTSGSDGFSASCEVYECYDANNCQ